MEITFLGTGTSTGVPQINCTCEVCRSADPHDKRLRSSLLVKQEGKNILIDCGPDFRQQMLREGVDRLDAVLCTHEHYDHVGGLDDLRPYTYPDGLNIYAESNVAEAIRTRLPYVFRVNRYPGAPNLLLHSIGDAPFHAAGLEIIPIRLMHGKLPILGFRIGSLAYLTDIKTIPETEFDKLKDLDILVISALRTRYHPAHETVDEALENIRRIRPRRAYLTHVSHEIGLHQERQALLPPGVFLAYDGLRVE